MHVDRTHHIDASEPDETGLYEYYYEYDLYHFTEGATCLVARSYVDEPDSAHFLRVEGVGHHRPLVAKDLTSSLFLAAQSHLHAAGKTDLSWLSGKGNGYEKLSASEQRLGA